jgi:hypothetical protein
MGKPKTDKGAAASRPAPENPDTATIVLSWTGILVAAGISATFNIYHDVHWLRGGLAILAGFLPPYLAASLTHIAAARNSPFWKTAVYAVTAGAMAISSIGTSETLAPGLTIYGGIGFSVVADAASLLFLGALIHTYSARATYKAWLAGQATGTMEPAGNRPGSENRQLVPEPAPATAMAVPEPATVVPAAVPGTSPPVPGVVPEPAPVVPPTVPEPVGAPPGTGSNVTPGPLPEVGPGEPGEDRDAVIADMRDRPRALESATREDRALDLITEFRRRTGSRMTDTELSRAMRVGKAAVSGDGGVRQAIRDREQVIHDREGSVA